MPFAPLAIPGVAGNVIVEGSFWRGYRLTLNGERLKLHGFPRTKLTLPGTAGPIQAKMKGGMLRAHPSVVVDDVEYASGPPTPWAQQVLALLPLLGLVLVQGALGFLVAFGGVAIGMKIIRTERSSTQKIALLVAIAAAVLCINGAILAAVIAAGGA